MGDHAGLVAAHRGLAVHIVTRRYRGVDEATMDDLIQQAMMGLFAAARAWDPDYGTTFAAYAGLHIRQHATRWHQSSSRAVHTTPSAEDRIRAIRSAGIRNAHDLDGMIHDTAVALVSLAWNRTLEMDAPMSGTDGLTYGDAIASDGDDAEDIVIERGMREWLYGRMLTLSDREREILESVYWRDESLAEVGRRLRISRERARQIRDEALDRMATKAERREWEAA